VNRRFFLQQSIAIIGLAAWGARADAAEVELADGLWLLTGYGGNVVVMRSPEGVLLLDGGAEAQSKRLLKRVRALTGARQVHTLFNTHWHRDHTGSNQGLGAAGTRIIAHENTKLWLGTEIDSKWEKKLYTRLPKQALPNQTFYTTGSLSFGGETIEYGHMPMAHTDGDIFIHLRKANVIIAGDVVAEKFPILDYSTNGWITGMINGLDTLQRRADDATRIIPGRGAVLPRAHLKDQSDMLTAVRLSFAKSIALGKSLPEALVEHPTRDFEARWGDPKLFVENVWNGMNRRVQELGQPIV
jgi:cyclase